MPDDARIDTRNNGDHASFDTAPSRSLVLRNEFAIVAIEVVGSGDHCRLRIEDMRAQVSVELDPLELESLAWAQHVDLAPLLDPNLSRWPSPGQEAE